MRIVCAPDSFKESMSAHEAAAAMARGVRHALGARAEAIQIPMADGGEGTADVVVVARGGRLAQVAARDALGRPIRARVGIVDDDDAAPAAARLGWRSPPGRLGIMDVASAIGLDRILAETRDPWLSTSHGAGDLLRALLNAGARRVVIGLGGSATNDGGAGLLEALGAILRDGAGRPVPARPDRLREVASIDVAGLDPRLAGLDMTLACDVTNPLVGPKGATAVFGPQKGVRAEDVLELDAALAAWAESLEGLAGRNPLANERDPLANVAGAGAAGGLGAAFLALGARMRPGVEVVAEAVGLDEAVAHADLVLTGEGSLDGQTLAGKVPAGVAAIAARHGVPVIAFGGRVDAGSAELLARELGLVDVVVINPAGIPLAQALRSGADNLADAVASTVGRLQS